MVDDKGERIPKYKRDFMKFYGDNGVRVVVGTFGPVKGVEMLLKKGYRHVYMSRHFATRFGLVPNEVIPGWVSSLHVQWLDTELSFDVDGIWWSSQVSLVAVG
jgi:hypothetical protein